MKKLIINIMVEDDRPDLMQETLEMLAKSIPKQIQDGNDWGTEWALEDLEDELN